MRPKIVIRSRSFSCHHAAPFCWRSQNGSALTNAFQSLTT
jgi:hypothetical protein